MGADGTSDETEKGELIGYMNSTKKDRIRSRPLILILLLLAAVCWSTLIEFASNWFMRSPGLYPYLIYVSQLFSFPFPKTCVVWLEGRSGGTGRTTWTVRLLLLAADVLFWIIMHWVGYRWDIRRRMPTQGFDVAVEGIPPVFSLQTENP